MHANLWGLREGKQYLMAVVRVVSGTVQIEGEVPPLVREELLFLQKRAGGDREFLSQLPRNFSGTYIRGQFVKAD